MDKRKWCFELIIRQGLFVFLMLASLAVPLSLFGTQHEGLVTEHEAIERSEGDTVEDAGLRKEVVVSRAYQPELPLAEKPLFMPLLTDTMRVERPAFEYHLLGRPLHHDFEVRPIAAARLGREPASGYSHLYIRAGFGGHISPLGTVLYTQRLGDRLALGVTLRHRSSFGRVTMSDGERVKAPYSRTLVGVNLDGGVGSLSLRGRLGYRHGLSTYYGYADSLGRIRDALYNQRTQTHRLHFGLDLEGSRRDSTGWWYGAGIDLQTYRDTHRMGEQALSIYGNVSHGLGEELRLGGDVGVDYWIWQVGETVANPAVVRLSPIARWRRGLWTLSGGLRFAFTNNHTHRIGIYPLVDFRYRAVGEVVIPFITINGDMEGTSYGQLRDTNPWLAPGVRAEHQSRKIDARLGITGSHRRSGVSYNVYGGYALIDRMHMWVNRADRWTDTANRYHETFLSSFDLEYANVQRLRVHAEVDYFYRQRLRFGLRGSYDHYIVEGDGRLWHTPNLTLSLYGEFNLHEKVVTTTDIFLQGGQKARGLQGEIISLGMIYDMNLAVRYRFTERSGIFAEVQNLLACRNSQLHLYPTHRFNTLLGFIFRF